MSSTNNTDTFGGFNYLTIFKLHRLEQPIEGMQYAIRVDFNSEKFLDAPLSSLDPENDEMTALMHIKCDFGIYFYGKVVANNPLFFLAIGEYGMEGNLLCPLTEEELKCTFEGYNAEKFAKHNITTWEEARKCLIKREEFFVKFIAMIAETVASELGSSYNAKIIFVDDVL